MSDDIRSGVVVKWETGIATGFTSKKEAERFIEHICKKTAPGLNYYIYSLSDKIKTK